MQFFDVGQHLVAAESEKQVRKIMREEGIGYRGMKIVRNPGPFQATQDYGETIETLTESEAINVWGQRPGLVPTGN